MAILGLEAAQPIDGFRGKATARTLALAGTQKRTMTPEQYPQLFAGTSGGRGGFSAARLTRLTGDFVGRNVSADADMFGDNYRLRARARQLAVDNFMARKFLAMVSQNVVGPAGVLMQAKVRGTNGKETVETRRINQRIEEEWNSWCKAGRCSADGKFSFVGLQHLVIKNCAREGENFAKDVLGMSFNAVGYAIQILDNDQLDDSMMVNAGENQIRLGVEVNMYGRPQAYHLFTSHPNDMLGGQRERKRVPASFITHTAVWERPGQTRGYTWLAASMLQMNQYGRYDEAVVVASRYAAAQPAYLESSAPEGYFGDEEDENGTGSGRNGDGTEFMSGDTGEIPDLPAGRTIKFADPRFPTNNHQSYTRTVLRNIASGLLVSYPSLANDLEGVNFSSIRAGMLDERDGWKILQRWFIEQFLEPIFQKWLSMAMLTVLSDITLSPAQREMISWKPRGWDWVDPLKDAQAIVLKLQNGLITYADALASLGLDFEETMTERAMEQAYLDALGITLGTDIRGQADTASDDSMSDEDDTSGGKAVASSTKRVLLAAQKRGEILDFNTRAEQIAASRVLYRQIRSLAA